MNEILSIAYADAECSTLHVLTNVGVIAVPWPCGTGYNDLIQDWLAAGNSIMEYASSTEVAAAAKAELARLELLSIRPASAIAAALAAGTTPDVKDVGKLTELEAAKAIQRASIKKA